MNTQELTPSDVPNLSYSELDDAVAKIVMGWRDATDGNAMYYGDTGEVMPWFKWNPSIDSRHTMQILDRMEELGLSDNYVRMAWYRIGSVSPYHYTQSIRNPRFVSECAVQAVLESREDGS